MKMDQRIFKIIFQLSKTQPWLDEKVEELQHLLFSECNCSDERELIIELLGRFRHVTEKEFADSISLLIHDIATTPNIDDSNTQIVAMTGDYSSDSAQFVLYALKAPLEKVKWREHITVTNFQRSLREFKQKGNRHYNIILVDEFVGSGRTAIGRVDTIKKLFLDHGINNITIRVKVLVASSVSVENVKKSGIDMSSCIEIEQGISGFYESDAKVIERKLALMDRLESILSSSYKGRELPKHGYGCAESLYVRDNGNTPNSVFPIFWWPFLQDGQERGTILTRAMGDA
ncbi:hypothetical protein [Pragia fontium]|uniref:phosphoribosyltransferase-like protein n=1 Tax=Pragia fontium TaxID=82985 RepID=UPI00064995F2|nr:hypothetical protein [Pragia fontium]AKJ43525.1 hypothetical protein QQ39_16900 [Pragia fontium]